MAKNWIKGAIKRPGALTAYLLKESFGQLWSYEREGWVRRFFDHWRASLKWQRLTPYEKFAAMIDRHWDGIAAYCRPENKISLGFVEGLNNKIRVIQRRAYGLRNEKYSRLRHPDICLLCRPWWARHRLVQKAPALPRSSAVDMPLRVDNAAPCPHAHGDNNSGRQLIEIRR